MNMLKWIIGGAFGGVIGAIIWALVVHSTGWEIGWIAIGVGALVGLGVRAAAKEDADVASGVTAIVVACAAIVGGKYLTVHLAVEKHVSSPVYTDEYLTSCLADEIVAEREDAGEEVRWPEGADLENPIAEKDFPPQIWAMAHTRWEGMDAQGRAAYRAFCESNFEEFKGGLRAYLFKRSFGVFGLIWMVIAGAAAFKLGGGFSG